MKELTLENIAPYIPYGLKLLYEHTNKIGQISNIYNFGEGTDNHDIKLSIDYGDGEHIWMFKPLLYPLEFLTKEIEHNGETFVPAIELYKIRYNDKFDFELTMTDDEIRYTYPDGKWRTIEYAGSYRVIKKLQEWHIDYQGLIPLNLAIDKSTLK